jgi:hypothetical protein
MVRQRIRVEEMRKAMKYPQSGYPMCRPKFELNTSKKQGHSFSYRSIYLFGYTQTYIQITLQVNSVQNKGRAVVLCYFQQYRVILNYCRGFRAL